MLDVIWLECLVLHSLVLLLLAVAVEVDSEVMFTSSADINSHICRPHLLTNI